LKGDVEDYFKFNGFNIRIEKSQIDYTIKGVEFNLKQRNVDHSYCLSILKYMFLAATVISILLYYKSVSIAES